LKEAGVEYIVLAGWLLVVPASFINRFENAIINIHPSLIPSFCGMGYYGIHVHEKAIEYGVKLSGATVHFVEADVDGGAILMQRAVEVLPDDTPEDLQARILKEEHKMLPECVKLLCQGKIRKESRKVFIQG
jgi:phosphoribosylglycinamide formyltransferase-1